MISGGAAFPIEDGLGWLEALLTELLAETKLLRADIAGIRGEVLDGVERAKVLLGNPKVQLAAKLIR